MSNNIEFEEETGGVTRPIPQSNKSSFMERLVFKTGFAKTQQGAQYVLLIIAIVCLLLAGIALFAGGVVHPAP
jgi:hypothetical protein